MNTPAMSNRTSAQSSRASSPIESGIRKRVGRACDRCRMKKSRCDGLTPCGKCKADNSICVYGRRKRSLQDKVYPRGYVEMLEQQQSQLVLGLQELYRRSTQHGKDQDAALVLSKTFGETMPTTHDLLEWLGALQHDDQNTTDTFHEDVYMMQAVAILDTPGSVKREESFDSISSQPMADHTPSFEPDDIHENDYTSTFTSHQPQLSFIDSPRLLPTNSGFMTATTTIEPTQTLCQIPWQLESAEVQTFDSGIWEPWMFDTDIQAISTAQTQVSQPFKWTSSDPCLSMQAWSLADTYHFDKGHFYT